MKKPSWTVIEDEISNAHNHVSDVLHENDIQHKYHNIFTEHKLASVLAVFGVMLLGVGLLLPPSSSFQAQLQLPNIPSFDVESSNPFTMPEDDEEIQLEPVEIDITPLTSTEDLIYDTEDSDETNPFDEIDSNPFDETDTGDTSNPNNPFDEIYDTINDNQDEPDTNPFNEVEDETDETENPFLLPIPSGEPEDITPASEPEPTVIEPIDNSPFLRTNTHTAKSNIKKFDGNIADPLDNISLTPILKETQFLHASSEIVRRKNSDSRYSGILQLNSKNTSYFPFSFYLQLADRSKLLINTNRDLRSVIGKRIDIEIEGSRDKFVLKHVYYNDKRKQQIQLVKSGPESTLIFLGILALVFSGVARRVKV